MVFSRHINKAGEYTYGWMRLEDSKRHGYFKRYNADDSVYQKGFNQDGNFAQDYQIKFSLSEKYAQKFDENLYTIKK